VCRISNRNRAAIRTFQPWMIFIVTYKSALFVGSLNKQRHLVKKPVLSKKAILFVVFHFIFYHFCNAQTEEAYVSFLGKEGF
jgi:hypothetical protein